MAGRALVERRWTPFVAAGAAVGLFAAQVIVTGLVDHKPLGNGYFGIGFVLAALAVGLVVARHQPRNPIGWLMLGIPAFVGAFLFAQALSSATFRHHPIVAVVSGASSELLYYGFIFLAPLVVLFFPDGRLPSPRWRPVLRAYLVMAAGVGLVTIAWGASVLGRGSWRFSSTGNLASNAPGVVVNVLTVVFLGAALVLALAWVVRRIVGFRHATVAVRQQYKWLAVGAISLVAALVLSFVTSGGHSTFAEVDNALTAVLSLPFPVTVGIAILRYRLYDIDRVLSRTVSYALLTGVLVAVYVGLVTFATRVLPFSSPVAVAASTLVAAAAFNPLRLRLQRLVDRRFNRSRYNAEATVAAFAERLRTTVDLGAVEGDLLVAVHRTLEPSAAAVWLRPR